MREGTDVSSQHLIFHFSYVLYSRGRMLGILWNSFSKSNKKCFREWSTSFWMLIHSVYFIDLWNLKQHTTRKPDYWLKRAGFRAINTQGTPQMWYFSKVSDQKLHLTIESHTTVKKQLYGWKNKLPFFQISNWPAFYERDLKPDSVVEIETIRKKIRFLSHFLRSLPMRCSFWMKVSWQMFRKISGPFCLRRDTRAYREHCVV